jgi:hypothetical protein
MQELYAENYKILTKEITHRSGEIYLFMYQKSQYC